MTLDDRSVARLMLIARVRMWLTCVHDERRVSGGCVGCWQAIRYVAKQPEVKDCPLARAVLALPERPSESFEDGPGREWTQTHADRIADVGAAVETAMREFHPKQHTFALLALRRATEGGPERPNERPDNRADKGGPRLAKTIRWASGSRNGNRRSRAKQASRPGNRGPCDD